MWCEFYQTPWQEDWPATVLSIGPYSELLYSGDGSGRLTAYTVDMARQFSVQTAWSPLHNIIPLDSEKLLAQTSDTLQVRTNGGIPLFSRSTTPNDAFTASALYSRQMLAFVCTAAGTGSLLSLDAGKLQRQVNVESMVVSVDFSQDTMALATALGGLSLRDTREPKMSKVLETETGGLAADMARSDYQVFVCGAGANAYAGTDDVVRVFDIRKLDQGPVDSIASDVEGVSAIKMQANGDDLWVCYNSGHAAAYDISQVGKEPEHWLEPELGEYAFASAFAVAPSGAMAAVADTDGILHLWKNDSKANEPLRLTVRGQEPDIPDVVSGEVPYDSLCSISFDDESVSLTACAELSNQMVSGGEPLLSSLDCKRLYDVGRPVNMVFPDVMSALRSDAAIPYAPNPGGRRRNQQPFGGEWRKQWRQLNKADDSEITRGRAKLLSQQHKHTQPSYGDRQSLVNRRSVSQVPRHLQEMFIEYSRFGIEDFDFSLYNNTNQHSGLEGNVPNSYADALIQLLFYMPPIRQLFLSHMSAGTDKCTDTSCLICHLAFVFRNLETAKGDICHATLFLHALAESTDAFTLGLLDNGNIPEAAVIKAYALRAQWLLRFLLEYAVARCKDSSGLLTPVEQMVGCTYSTTVTCPSCHSGQSKTSHALSVNVASLSPTTSNLAAALAGGAASVKRAKEKNEKMDFLGLLAYSLGRGESTRAWCVKCSKYQMLNTKACVTKPPPGYMVFNLPMPDEASYLSASRSSRLDLPTEFSMSLVDDNERPVRLTPPDEDTDEATTGFKLVAVVSGIRDSPQAKDHLVLHVRDPDDPKQWLLFNDFLVHTAAEESVTKVVEQWRTPSIVIYANDQCQDNLSEIINQLTPYRINGQILTNPKSILDSTTSRKRIQQPRQQQEMSWRIRNDKRNDAIPLTIQELEKLRAGEFCCAMDAEYVVLEEAKVEKFSDGTRDVLRPATSLLARLTVVRGSPGSLHGVPFIDDYVEATQPIEDLATAYSGIHRGDLTRGTSPYKLSTMKEVYIKLRLLVDSGCSIIGHNLKHDLRVCNIVVPPSQQHDTMILYQSPVFKRQVALKFLYWYVTGNKIQQQQHSSTIDAQATLTVYEYYQDYREGTVDKLIDDIYAAGVQHVWEIPK